MKRATAIELTICGQKLVYRKGTPIQVGVGKDTIIGDEVEMTYVEDKVDKIHVHEDRVDIITEHGYSVTFPLKSALPSIFGDIKASILELAAGYGFVKYVYLDMDKKELVDSKQVLEDRVRPSGTSTLRAQMITNKTGEKVMLMSAGTSHFAPEAAIAVFMQLEAGLGEATEQMTGSGGNDDNDAEEKPQG